LDPERRARWEKTSIVKLEGQFSGFLAKKVSKIFGLREVAEGLHTTKGPSSRFNIDIVASPPTPSAVGPRPSA
jgi:hypothetical protein